MIEIGDTLVSSELFTQCFVCSLEHCKGICCVEGDSGAPLTIDEQRQIEQCLPQVLPLLPVEAQNCIRQRGVAYTDQEGDLVTQLVNGAECVFCIKENDCTYCAIEKAYRAGLIPFQKPVSCHLYPVRLHPHARFMAVEYHRWSVCKDACRLGKQLQVPLYQFLKEPLIRRFGTDWYNELCTAAQAFYASDYYKQQSGK